MGCMKAVFDSNILIDYLRGIEAAKKEITLYDHPCISMISWMEVLIGSSNDREEKVIRTFLERFHLLEVTKQVSELAVTIRKQNKIRLPDAIIWATAKHHQALLITRNIKDFPDNSPEIRVPYSV